MGDIVNEMLVQMNIYLKAEGYESPMETGFYTGPGFPQFRGDPKGKGTDHYAILNKYRRRALDPIASTKDFSVGT